MTIATKKAVTETERYHYFEGFIYQFYIKRNGQKRAKVYYIPKGYFNHWYNEVTKELKRGKLSELKIFKLKQ